MRIIKSIIHNTLQLCLTHRRQIKKRTGYLSQAIDISPRNEECLHSALVILKLGGQG